MNFTFSINFARFIFSHKFEIQHSHERLVYFQISLFSIQKE